MSGDPAEGEDVFPGSEGATSMVAWIDQRLVEVQEGRGEAALEAIESGRWRAELDLAGLPPPILAQAAEALHAAAGTLRDPGAPADAAARALLLARSRFLPGA